METIATRIQAALRKKNGGNQSEMARYIGVSPQAVQKWIAGESEPRGRNLEIAANFLGVTQAYLKFGEPQSALAVGKEKATSPYAGPERRSESSSEHYNGGPELQLKPGRYVAIVGTGQGGQDGYLSIDDYPPGQGNGEIYTYSPDPNAYAIRVQGDSMRPRIKSGEFIVAEPNTEAQPGDDVVVKLKNDKVMVKELLWHRDGEVSLGSINANVPPITVPNNEIVSIHRVAAIVPRGSALLRPRQE